MPWAARIRSLARILTRFPLGLYEIGAAKLFVTTGIGVSLIPARFGISAEVAVLTLRS